MNTKETSKLKRYRILFVISTIGFMIILFVDRITGIYSHEVVSAHPKFASFMGIITGLLLASFILFGLLALLESNDSKNS
jgi:hypothetical protein